MSEDQYTAADYGSLRQIGVDLGQWGQDVDTPEGLLRGTVAEYPLDETFGTGDEPTSELCRKIVDPTLENVFGITGFFRYALGHVGGDVHTVAGVFQDADTGAADVVTQVPKGPVRH